jgi:hypothetical protein
VTWKKHNPYQQYVDDFGATQYPYQAGTNGDQYSRLDRVTNEIKQIAAISGNNVTFNSPLTISDSRNRAILRRPARKANIEDTNERHRESVEARSAAT